MTRIIPPPGPVFPAQPPASGLQTITMGGSGGALSNGTVSIGGIDWTVYGIGTTGAVGIRALLTDILASYEPESILQVVAALDDYVASTADTGMSIKRTDTTLALFDEIYLYRTGNDRWFQTRTDTGVPDTTQIAGATLCEGGGHLGLISGGGSAQATGDSVVATTPTYPMEHADAFAGGLAFDRTAAATPFGAGDYLQFELRNFTSSVACTITQTATGLDMVAGAATCTLTDLYVQ